MISYIKKPIPDNLFYGIAILLLLPALLTNLGIVAFINDEGIRSLVALEMKLSGNYFVPTLYGKPYYNKPPLYNWILLAFFEITNVINEWTARIPTVLFLCAFGGTVFYFFKKHFTTKIAFLNAFALITSGRILFYDSILGLIDICFSWVIFLMFMLVYHHWKRQRFFALFGWAYFLGAAGFMMKGLPAIVFLGTTLLAHFVHQKQFKKLFSIAHFFGIGIFILLIASYYVIYQQYESLEPILGTLLNESTKRTATEFGWADTILHLFTFPFEMIFHFLPWTIFVLYFFEKGRSFKKLYQKILKNEFVSYNLLIFCITVVPYWLSVQVYPRYIFMLVPLIFSVLFYLYDENKSKSWQRKFIERIFLIVSIIAIFLPLIPLFIETMQVDFFYPKIAILMIVFGILAVLFHYQKNNRLLIFIIILLAGRLGFDWFVLPSRVEVEWGAISKNTAINAGKSVLKKPLFVHPKTLGLPYSTGFYFSREINTILTRKDRIEASDYFLIYPASYPKLEFEKIDSFYVVDEKRLYFIGRTKD